MCDENRDHMIIVGMEALEKVLTAEASMIFEDAAVVVDALLEHYNITPKETVDAT